MALSPSRNFHPSVSCLFHLMCVCVCNCTVSSLNLRVRQTRTRIDPCKISHLSPTLVTSPLPRRNSAQGQWHYCLHECRIYSFVRVSFSTSNLTTSSDGGLERIPVRAAARLRPRLVRSDQTLNDLQKDNDTLKSKVNSDVTVVSLLFCTACSVR